MLFCISMYLSSSAWLVSVELMFCLDSLLIFLVGAALAAALRSHGETSTAVAEEGLGAIASLSTGNAANRTRLGEAGACKGVVMRLAGLLRFCLWSS